MRRSGIVHIIEQSRNAGIRRFCMQQRRLLLTITSLGPSMTFYALALYKQGYNGYIRGIRICLPGRVTCYC